MSKTKYPYEFDPKKRKIAKEYRRGKFLHYFLGLFISLGIALFILFSGLNLSIRDFSLQYPFPTLVNAFLVFLIFTITGFPLSFYSSFVFDHKFKLSRYTISGWFKDFLKGNLIYYIISLLIISGLYFSIYTFSPWWVYAGILFVIFSITMNYVYPFVIIPFMWRTSPYHDRLMKNRILKLCRKIGVTEIENVTVIKESEKSVRPNAVFMGFGNSKQIGLFDTLLNTFTRNEVETVVGHELGHYVNKDILQGIILEAILIFPMLFAVDYFVGIYGHVFGIQAIGDLASLPLIGLIYGTLNFILMPLGNTYSRWRESEADKFALMHVGKPVAQVSTEKRLADLHLSEVEAHPLLEFWFYSHPATIRRINMAKNWKIKKR